MLFTFLITAGMIKAKKAVMHMNQYEQIDLRLFPSQGENSRLILPTNIGVCKTVYPYCFSRADLQSCLLLYTLCGEGQLEYNGGLYPLRRGDLFFIDCMAQQTYKAVSEYWDFAFVHTTADTQIAAYYAAITQNGKSPVFHYTPFMKDCWEKLYQTADENKPEAPVQASLYLVSLFLSLLELRRQSVPEDLKSAADYIKAHYNEKISLPLLADLAHLSKYHFIRRFYQFYSVTPHEYLQLCRMDRAKSQLLCTDASIEDIASLCGYTSASAFCQSFKKYNNLSPSVFRKQMKIL